MNLRLFQIDAFTSRLFGGNPAGVVPLDSWLPTETMQAIAMENNLAETAFFIPSSNSDADFELRWFTPNLEMDLCGHATLAAAHALRNHLGYRGTSARFMSKSGLLVVSAVGDRLVLDFPSRPGKQAGVTSTICDALRATPAEIWTARDMMAVFKTEAEVRALAPDMDRVAALDTFAVIATAPGERSDFVSRYFAPKAGVPEDPVTGSAHCTLIPYWARRLSKEEMFARQISPRGGELNCRNAAERVHIGGHCVTYLDGTILV